MVRKMIRRITIRSSVTFGPRCLQNDVDAYISMASSEEALKELRKSNVPVINAPQAVLYGCQNRMLQYAFLRQRGFQVPGDKGSDGYWIKKNNGYSECEQDVVFAQDAKSRDKAVTIMKLRGIANSPVPGIALPFPPPNPPSSPRMPF